MLSFLRLSIYRRSAWIDRGSTRMNRSFTWAMPGWSGAHPGWLVWNYRSASGVSVTATIISPRIVRIIPVTYRVGPGLCRE
jgi:hypothetical protein